MDPPRIRKPKASKKNAHKAEPKGTKDGKKGKQSTRPQHQSAGQPKSVKRARDGQTDQTSKKRTRPSAQSSLQSKFKAKLESGQFRWLNEQLYSTTSEEAVQLFRKDESLYRVYHRGFETQVAKWPENPVCVIIDILKEKAPVDAVIGDFGCGDARIARTLGSRFKVHSFDLCKTNKHVTVANSANVPLESESLDVAVFCLSLMGTDFDRFLLEARRCLKPNGLLIIAEVKSRFASEGGREKEESRESMLGGLAEFKATLKHFHFALKSEEIDNTMFVLLQLRKLELKGGKEAEKALRAAPRTSMKLKSCKYKKR